MARLIQTICPKCKVAPKEPGMGYCKPCRKAYSKAYNALRHRMFQRTPKPEPEDLQIDWDLEPYGRKHLGLTDNLQPSTDYLEAYCGWGADRNCTPAYRRSGFDSSNDWSQSYQMGHNAVRRFWNTMTGGSAWEMGPDLHEFVDGQFTGHARMKGYRYGMRNMSPRRQIR